MEAGAFKVETARQLLDMLNQTNRKLDTPSRRATDQFRVEVPFFPFRNDSGETIPPFACMQVTGVAEVGERFYLTVDKPVDNSGEDGPYLFNLYREIGTETDDKFGTGTVYGMGRVRCTTSSPAVGTRIGPQASSWDCDEFSGGFLTVMGDDPDNSGVVFVSTFRKHYGMAVFETPGGGIPAISGTTLGSATCTLQSLVGGTIAATSTTDTVYNMASEAVAGSVNIQAALIDGIWVANWEDC